MNENSLATLTPPAAQAPDSLSAQFAVAISDTGRAWRELPCRSADPDTFFAETPIGVELAKSLCLDCPVRELCLAAALERAEPWGVWGGQLFVNGAIVAQKRPRGRPRKQPDAEPARLIPSVDRAA